MCHNQNYILNTPDHWTPIAVKTNATVNGKQKETLMTTYEAVIRPAFEYAIWCCCCLPTPPCLFGGVLPYFEVTGHPVPVSSLGFKCPDCFIWNCSYIVYPS